MWGLDGGWQKSVVYVHRCAGSFSPVLILQLSKHAFISKKLLNPKLNHTPIQRLIPSIFASCLPNIKVSIAFFFTMISISTGNNNDDEKHWCSFYHLISITPGLLFLIVLSSSSRLVPVLLPFYRWEDWGRRSKITCSSSHGKWGIEIWI